MGQKASWKFLFPGSLQKSQVIKNFEAEISAASKIFQLRNREAGCVSSLWLHLYCFSEEQAKASTKKLLGNLFANWFQKFNENKNRIAGFYVFILPALSYPFNFLTESKFLVIKESDTAKEGTLTTEIQHQNQATT